MPDRRTEKTIQKTKDALLELLREKPLDSIAVAELTRKAQISRSTFYCHFQNVCAVYELLVSDFLSEVGSIKEQVHCQTHTASDSQSGKQPYCLAIRTTTKYHDVVRERQYLATMLRIYLEGRYSDTALYPYLQLGIDKEFAWCLLTFQMTGCHMAAVAASDDDAWARQKRLIDTFIAGGMNAVSNDSVSHSHINL